MLAASGRKLVLVKMDIDGAANAALSHRVIESHSCEEDAAIGVLTRSVRFDAHRVSDARWVSQPTVTYPNPDGIWGTLLLVPREHTAEVRRLLS
jgi:hypothetical protein